MYRYFILLFVLVLYTGCSNKIYFEQKPIQFDSTRTALSLQYLHERYGIKQDAPTITPKMVVVHWTAIPTFNETFAVFDPPTLRNTRPDIQGAGALNVSAHYLIDRDGRIAQLLPDTVMARHVIGLNYAAIGIENVGSDKHPLTDAQLRADARLIRKLADRYDIQYLIGHYEYQLFEDSPLWKEKNDSYRTKKTDPGTVFMIRLRDKLKDLKLKGPPELNGHLKTVNISKSSQLSGLYLY
jgi:N-acetyl-anhydromuramyl-L-alanine amidase AmpD